MMQVPGWASVRGLADADATVAVNGNPAFMVGRAAPSAPNPGDLAYFFGSDDFDNSAAGGFAELEVSATVSDGTNDFVSVATNRVFVPPANETYAYDADGNQTLVTTGTGAWQVEYNGENRPVRWTCGDRTLLMDYDHMGRRRSYVEQKGNVVGKRHVFTYLAWEKVDFTPACNNHDICYGTCGEDKSKCNQKLEQDMKNVCDGVKDSVVRRRCNSIAELYRYALDKNFLSEGPYQDAQDEACDWRPCCEIGADED